MELTAVALGGFVLGLVVGALVLRRGRRLHIDWRLRISADEDVPPDDQK